MSGFLFEQIIFGPVRSRRLGISLGINLLPANKKHCTFNCIYCECGWSLPLREYTSLPSAGHVKAALEQKLADMVRRKALLDNITFAGNGEPTLHPDFAEITCNVIELRNRYYPEAKISLLSNASRAAIPGIREALISIDQPILKLDAGTDNLFQLINQPFIPLSIHTIVDTLVLFNGRVVIQTLFFKGYYNGRYIDNTLPEEIEAWIGHLIKIKPKLVMIYSIARDTPVHELQVIPHEELTNIAHKLRKLQISVNVY